MAAHDRAHADFPPGHGPTNPYRPFRVEDVEQSIAARFAQQVAADPDQLAVATATERLTYAELDRAANRLAAAILDRRGAKALAAEPVAFLVEHGCPQIVAILGILKAGKIYVPLDASYPQARGAAVLVDARPALLVTDNAHAQAAQRLSAGCCPLVSLDELAGSADADPRLSLTPDRPANIIYTSGSTGKPKGLVHSQRNILHTALKYTNNLHVSRNDRLVLLYSCAFAGSVADIFSALLNGATLAPFDVKRRGVAELGRWLADERITLYQSVPTVFRQFVAALENAGIDGGTRFPDLRLLRLGGEPVTTRDVQLHRRHFAPGCLLAISLGATEILGIRLNFVPRDLPLAGGNMPVGYALQDTDVLILGDDGKPAAAGAVGEMVVRSPYLAQGYWGDAERSRADFPPDPQRPGTRVYRLGDLGRLRPDGCLEYLGRADSQVKIRGYRVEVAEIEGALLAQEGVKDAVVIGRPTVSGGQRLVAYLVFAAGHEPALSSLRGALLEMFPDYMIPSVFVTLDALPTTPTGKVDRLALPEPASARPALAVPYEPPGDPLHVLLADVWQECLNVRPVGIRDDFFELGGDSILAMEMALQCEALLGRAIPEGTLLTAPTVELLARWLLDREPKAVRDVAHQVQAGTSARRLFYLHGDMNGGGVYCAPLVRLLGRELTILAVPPHGLSSPIIPATIEHMASDRLAVVRAIQPEGPYLLAGYCNGGLVAFEMAQQLRRLGQRVDFLGLIAPPFDVQIGPIAAAAVPAAAPARASGRFDVSRAPLVERRRALIAVYAEVCRRYVMAPVPGEVVVVFPKSDLKLYGPLDRWHTIGSRVTTHVVSGGHLTILAARNLPELARALRASLVL